MENSIIKRIRRLIFLSLFNILLSRTTKFWALKRFILRLACIKVGNTTRVVGPLICGNAVQLCFGDGTWVGQDFYVYGSGRCEIGKNCDIGPNVVVLSGAHEIGNKDRRAGKGFHYNIHIGNGVWIGGRVTIFGNIKIGDSSIIAAGAVVQKNVSENVVVAGVPATTIRDLKLPKENNNNV